MCLTGCRSEEVETAAEVEEVEKAVKVGEVSEEVSEEGVKLEDVPRPEVGEPYMVLSSVGEYDVLWGEGFPCYLTADSGLPGFGYPMLVTGGELDVGDEVTLETSYGVFEYQGGEEADIDAINFGKQEEVLYLRNEDGSCRSYALVSGPEIIE